MTDPRTARRDFLKGSLASLGAVAALGSVPACAASTSSRDNAKDHPMAFTLPALPYPENALEPRGRKLLEVYLAIHTTSNTPVRACCPVRPVHSCHELKALSGTNSNGRRVMRLLLLNAAAPDGADIDIRISNL